MHAWRTALALLLVLGVRAVTATTPSEGSCYYPDGNPGPPGGHPCKDPKEGHSACCPKDAYCAAGGLCWAGHMLFRAGCTDSSWTDPACPLTCRHFGPPSSTQMISPWTVLPNTFCCGLLSKQNGTCYDSDGREAPDGIAIDYPDSFQSFANDSYGNLLPWLDLDGRRLPGSQPVNAARGGDSSLISGGSVSASTNSNATAAPGTTSNGTAPPSADPASASRSSDDKSQAANVGVGVGVALGVCLAAALLANWWQWRRIVHMRAAAASAGAMSLGAYAGWPPQYSESRNYAGMAGQPVKEGRGQWSRVEMDVNVPLPELPESVSQTRRTE